MSTQSPVEAIFLAALDQPAGPPREAYLADACRGDHDLRRRVERLLDAHPEVGSFLEKPAVEQTGAYEPAGGTPGERIGPYKLLQKLGEGGMGAVWMAEQEQPVRRMVALKLVKPGMDSAQVCARFEAERQALALMDHPNIAKVLDAGMTETGRPYFVMELVKGVPITKFCDEHHLTPRQRLELFIPVCQAVQHAHQKGIIHRDLKPSNVMVALYDDKPVPKIIDFGVAKALSQRLTEKTMYTEFGALVGTLEYMSPEQAKLNALDIDTRSDIYSLGVILYELLAGSTLFDRKRLRRAALDELFKIIREEEPPKPSTRLSTSGNALPLLAAGRGTEPAKLSRLVKGELDWIVMKALEKDRTRRYETANGLARDIERYLHDEPVEACPPSAAYRLKKLARRYKGPAAAAALVLLTLVVGIVGTAWGLVEARRQRDTAEQQRLLAEQERDEREKARQAEEEQRKAAVAAKDRAEQERQRADEEAATANTILKFVENDVFGFGRVNGNPLGMNVTLRDALDAAEPHIGRAFADRPLVEVRLRNVLSNSYRMMGEASLRNQQAQKAYDVGFKKLGPDHRETLRAELMLNGIQFDSGRRAEAVRSAEAILARLNQSVHPDYDLIEGARQTLAGHYEQVGRRQDLLATRAAMVEDAKRQFGPAHPEVYVQQALLGQVLMNQGPIDEAIRVTELALKALTEMKGPDSLDTLLAASVLGRCYAKAGRHDDAIRLMERTYQAMVRTLGLFHSQSRAMQRNLPIEYGVAGRPEEAIRFLEELIPQLRKREGEFGFGVAPELINLASAYRKAGRDSDAVTLLEPVVAAWLGKDQELASNFFEFMVNNLTSAYDQLGRHEDSIRLWEQIHDGRVRRLGPSDPSTLQAANRLSIILTQAKQYDRLASMFRKRLVAGPDGTAADDPERANTLVYLGKALVQAGRAAEAEPGLRECLAIREKKLPDNWLTCNARSLLGGVLASQQKYAEAEPLLIQGYEGLKRREATIPAAVKIRPVQALGRLVQFFETTGRFDEAANRRKEFDPAVAAYRRSLGAEQDTALARTGKDLIEDGLAAAAEPLLRACLTIREQKQPNDLTTDNARALLGKALADQKHYDEAEPLPLRGYEGLKRQADKVPATNFVQPADALAWLVNLYEAWGKPDEAAKWQKEREAVKAAPKPPPTP